MATRYGHRSTGTWIARLCLAVTWLLAAESIPAAEQAEPAKPLRGVLIRFEGDIMPQTYDFLRRRLDAAVAERPDVVIVEIDSPGGRLDLSEEIAFQLRDLPGVKTVAYVPHKALSGAAIAALGTDEIVMGAQARLGDAGPIYMDENFLFRHAPEKIRSDLVQVVRGLAQAKGRPPALAEAMVDMNAEVFKCRDKKGNISYLTESEKDALQGLENLGLVEESKKDRFLEVSGERAVELGLAAAVVHDRDELSKRYGLGSLKVIEPTGVDTAVWILTRPLVTALLIVVGLIALYVEFSVPGVTVGWMIAGLCAALFFWSHFLGGTAGWLEVVLFLAGVVFLAVELLLIPGFGVTGLTGILLILVSLVMAMQGFVVPHNATQLETTGMAILVVFGSMASFVVAGAILTWYTGRVPILGRLVLAPPDPNAAPGGDQSTAASEAPSPARGPVQVGQLGVAVTPLRPAGRVRFGDEYVDVLTEGDFLDQGTEVRVYRVQGFSIVVRQVE